MENTESLNNAYYANFGTETERRINIENIKAELRDLISLKYATLETLEQKITCEKCDLSTMQRELL